MPFKEVHTMKQRIISLLFLSVFLAGCAQTVSTYSLGSIDSPPSTTYTMYQYSSGAGERLRVVLLKHPESNVEIVPYSVQIVETKGTLEDAYRFIDRGNLFRHTSVLGVAYKGKTVGYLMEHRRHTFSRDEIRVDFFERDGKVYFSVTERLYND
jgi:hypothetical protein